MQEKETKPLYKYFTDQCIACLLTVDGEPVLFMSRSKRALINHADFIQEMMIFFMKDEVHKKGRWLWRFKRGRPTNFAEGLLLRPVE